MKETPSKVGYLRKIVKMFSAGYFLSDQQSDKIRLCILVIGDTKFFLTNKEQPVLS